MRPRAPFSFRLFRILHGRTIRGVLVEMNGAALCPVATCQICRNSFPGAFTLPCFHAVACVYCLEERAAEGLFDCPKCGVGIDPEMSLSIQPDTPDFRIPLCTQCGRESINVLLQPCGHIVDCSDCVALDSITRRVTCCPVCKASIDESIILPKTERSEFRLPLCTKCGEETINTLLHPCGHVASCKSCLVRDSRTRGVHRCPVCETSIEARTNIMAEM